MAKKQGGSPKQSRFGGKQKSGKSRSSYFAQARTRIIKNKENNKRKDANEKTESALHPVEHDKARNKRRAVIKVFNRHKTLEKSNDQHATRRGWLPDWKAKLVDTIKPMILANAIVVNLKNAK